MENDIFIFDCEVFAHDWLFVFKEIATGEYTIIHNDNDAVVAFMERNPFLGGFNNKHYDNFILKGVMCGLTPEQIKEINDLTGFMKAVILITREGGNALCSNISAYSAV